MSTAEMPHSPNARSERRSSYKPVRRSTEADRHGFRETAQAHGGNRRPTWTEETFPEKASDGRRTILSTARTNRLPERAALKCKERFVRNRDKLFTFLNYDGVPWNNNNAEHAIKAFARLRDVIAGSSTEKGIEEYLTLLSICQTCEYTGLDFLDFLRSGEKDVHAFAENRRGRKRQTNQSQCAGQL
jgi:hypothetical protein